VAIQLAALLMRLADLDQQLLFTSRPPRRRPAAPGIESAAAHLPHPAHHPPRPALAMRADEGVLHGCSFAKNAAAFFKISRSISSCAFSLRSRRSSAFNAPSPEGATPASAEN